MKTRFFVLLGLVFSLTSAPPAAGATNLLEMVRELNRSQEQAVAGFQEAYDESQRRLAEIERVIPSIEAAAFNDEPTLRALAIYLLCGGRPNAVRKLFNAETLQAKSAPIVAGALAYAEGRKQEASQLLGPINARELPISLAGHLSLVQGGLLLNIDKKAAVNRLDWARLLTPGSLVEEAAIRRELSALHIMADQKRYLVLARRYSLNYSRSPFARNFLEEIRQATIDHALDLPSQVLDEVETYFLAAGDVKALEWRLALVRLAVLSGHADVAAAHFARAQALPGASGAKERMALYAAAIKAEMGDVLASAEELGKAPETTLNKDEIKLKRILDDALKRLKAAPAASGSVAPSAIARPNDAAESKGEEPPIVLEARKSLAETDALLKRAVRP